MPAPRPIPAVLTVVANRLPVERFEGEWRVPPGGLVSALRGVIEEHAGSWVGWDGETQAGRRHRVPPEVDGVRLVNVPLSVEERAEYYEGFANETLWPLYHDKVRPPIFHRRWWHTFEAVNRRFARTAAEATPHGGAVWVHDYHLSLVPQLIRADRPDLHIGFFLHVPFPPMELFAQLPWRRQLIDGMLGADALGFQTVYGARNFRAAARRWRRARTRELLIHLPGREVRSDALPIAVDAAQLAHESQTLEIRRRVADFRERLGGRRILLGVDRLDYTKGIEIRLRGYETLLDREPTLADEVAFVQVAVPSREDVAGYAAMREEIEGLAGRINGKHARLGQPAVQYRYGAVSHEDLVALYTAASAMIVTPLRDGMNLVAKEYVACHPRGDGFLVLSEFAGAALELHLAEIVNPYDPEGIADALGLAARAGGPGNARRMRAMHRQVIRHDVHRWARRALEAFVPDA